MSKPFAFRGEPRSCLWCGDPLRPNFTHDTGYQEGMRVRLNAGERLKAVKRDLDAKFRRHTGTFGYGGDGFFCSLTCGYRWAAEKARRGDRLLSKTLTPRAFLLTEPQKDIVRWALEFLDDTWPADSRPAIDAGGMVLPDHTAAEELLRLVEADVMAHIREDRDQAGHIRRAIMRAAENVAEKLRTWLDDEDRADVVISSPSG